MKRNFKRILSLIFGVSLILLFSYFSVSFNSNSLREVVSNVDNIINLSQIEDKLVMDDSVYDLQKYYGNSDVKGIISIEGLNNFSYPIVQSHNNDYYLNHNYYKKYDAYGAIYADYRVDLDNSRKVLIFGHSSTKRYVPFNELENYWDRDFYNDHKYIILNTETNTYRYEIFSVYVETKDFTYMNINFDNEEDWYSHILNIKNKSIYSIDAELNKDDDILILQTCSTNSKYRNYSKKYLLIVSRRVSYE